MGKLNFIMSKFFLNGTLDSIRPLDAEFIMCSKKSTDDENYGLFGNNIINECNLDLTHFYNHDMRTFFYEIFLEVDGNYFSIPILVDNIENEAAEENLKFGGARLNNDTDMANWILTRRMFLYHKDKDNKLVTYAKSIKIVIEKVKSSSTIYTPYIEVFYLTREYSDLQENPTSKVCFQIQYSEDIQKFMNVMLGLFIAIIVIVLAITVYRMHVWVKLNPKELTSSNYVLQFCLTLFFKLCKFWGIFMFWFCFIISAYWYFFYKLQYRVYLLLPPVSNEFYNKYYKKFDIVFGIGCGVYILYMIYRIYKQVTFDIFFVDWEQEKEIFSNSVGRENFSMISKYKKYRCAWRLLHVANQFNALQKKRLISLYFGFVWYILLYYRCGWSNRELNCPHLSFVENSPVNYLLRFFLVTVIILSVGVIQFCLYRLLQIWLPLKKQEFVDLCTVANISVLIFDESLHGFYIHGKSPEGKADLNLNELLKFLERESQSMIKPRGIGNDENAEDDGIHCYEMYISYIMRTTYDGLYCFQTEVMTARNNDINYLINRSKLGNVFRYISNEGIQLSNLGSYMNKQLKNKLENINKISKKTMIQRILDYPPGNVEDVLTNVQDIILYKDENFNFDDVFFSGMEWEWYMMDVFILQMWMIALDNAEIALFLCFICDQILYYIRVYLGEKNVGKKAVIDDRFFS